MTTTRRPPIPKPLAARIRGAQRKVEDARLSIAHGEDSIRKDRARIAEFESDPQAFSARWYQGRPVDSDPIRITMERTRESLSYRQRKMPVYVERLSQADAELARVEAEVLAKVEAMQPTLGREPWPKPLRSFASYQTEFSAESIQADADALINKAERELENERLFQEETAENDRINRIEEEEMRAEIAAFRAKMTPEERDESDHRIAALREALKTGKITAQQLIDGLNAKSVTE